MSRTAIISRILDVQDFGTIKMFATADMALGLEVNHLHLFTFIDLIISIWNWNINFPTAFLSFAGSFCRSTLDLALNHSAANVYNNPNALSKVNKDRVLYGFRNPRN